MVADKIIFSFVGNEFENADLQTFIDDVKKLIVDEALVKGSDRRTKVVDFKHPEELTVLMFLSLNASDILKQHTFHNHRESRRS